jgi:protein gp37
MAETTEISWCDATFNPWIGCARISEACRFCYAAVDTFARTKRAQGLELWGPKAARHVTSEAYWQGPRKWNAAAEREGRRRRVFCASMADVFEAHDGLDAERARLWALIEQTPWLDWLLLTKRPQNIRAMLPPAWLADPRPNVWLGTTVEDQARADERIPRLLDVPAAVRFLSCEPLLGPVDLTRVDMLPREHPHDPRVELNALTGHVAGPDDITDMRVDWVIVGGESGPGARITDAAHIRAIVDQCRVGKVPVFVKQLGRVAIDTDWHGLAPLPLRDPKGGDMAEFPEDLRVREFPEVSR